MKALLRYGEFTHFIDIPRREREIRLIKPRGRLKVNDPEYGDLTVTAAPQQLLVFEFSKQLAEDLLEYVFTGEA